MSDEKARGRYEAVCRRLSGLVADRRGNVATIFALLLVPLIGCIGAAVDYSLAVNHRTKIISALDAAVLTAVSASELKNSASVAQANALKMFKAQMSLEKFPVGSVSITVTDDSNGRSAKGSAGATATTGMPPDIDFYMLLDNTPSMGVAAS